MKVFFFIIIDGTCVVYVRCKGTSVMRENTGLGVRPRINTGLAVVLVRRPLVRDYCGSCASGLPPPAGQRGPHWFSAPVVVSTRSRRPGRPATAAAAVRLARETTVPARGSHCTEAERFTPNQSRVHRFRKIRPGGGGGGGRRPFPAPVTAEAMSRENWERGRCSNIK